jgi:hypothetical protein
MKTKIDTSINIENKLLARIEKYTKFSGISKEGVITKVLAHFIKQSRRGIFLKARTVGYQPKKGCYKKLTLHLDSRELEIFRQIRVVTLLSTSYVLFIAMELFGDKLFSKAEKSRWALSKIKNYTYWGSYPEYSIYMRATFALSRYWISHM